MVKALQTKILLHRLIIGSQIHKGKVASHAAPVARHLVLERRDLAQVLIEARVLPAKSAHLKLRLWVDVELLVFGNRG